MAIFNIISKFDVIFPRCHIFFDVILKNCTFETVFKNSYSNKFRHVEKQIALPHSKIIITLHLAQTTFTRWTWRLSTFSISFHDFFSYQLEKKIARNHQKGDLNKLRQKVTNTWDSYKVTVKATECLYATTIRDQPFGQFNIFWCLSIFQTLEVELINNWWQLKTNFNHLLTLKNLLVPCFALPFQMISILINRYIHYDAVESHIHSL